MNILEAMKGKPRSKLFRRKGWKHFGCIKDIARTSGGFSIAASFEDGSYEFLSADDIFANDWEMKEEKVLISESQLLEVYALGHKHSMFPKTGGTHENGIASSFELKQAELKTIFQTIGLNWGEDDESK